VWACGRVGTGGSGGRVGSGGQWRAVAGAVPVSGGPWHRPAGGVGGRGESQLALLLGVGRRKNELLVGRSQLALA
jgi:hypothetical protein